MSKNRLRQRKNKRKYRGGSLLYLDITYRRSPTRKVKDPTPHFAYEKDKDASGAYGYGFPRSI